MKPCKVCGNRDSLLLLVFGSGPPFEYDGVCRDCSNWAYGIKSWIRSQKV